MILATIAKLTLAVAVGYYLYKKGIFTEEINQKLSYFILNICMPLLIVTSLNGTEGGSRGQIFFYIVAGLCFYGAMPFIGKVLNCVFRVKKEERLIYEAFYIFPNNMFMGYPVCASIFGNSCIFYISMFNLAYNLMYYTYGNYLFGEKDEKRSAGEIAKSILNPGVVASCLAIAMFFLDIQLPDPVVTVFHFLADLTSPLSMVVIGSVIGSYSFRSLLKSDWRIYVLSVIRLVIMPAVTYVIMSGLGFSGTMLGIAVISLGMPVGTMVSMGCIKAQNHEELGAAGVMVTTILSLLTIPVLLVLMG